MRTEEFLTKEQYKFLKHFTKKCKQFKKEDETLGKLDREKLSICGLINLLKKNKSIFPAEPLGDDIDEFFEWEQIKYLKDTYLEKIGLKDCIEIYDSAYCGITSVGLSKMSAYRVRILNSRTFKIITLILSILGFLLSLCDFVLVYVVGYDTFLKKSFGLDFFRNFMAKKFMFFSFNYFFYA